MQFCANAERGAHLFQPMPLVHFGGLNTASNPILFFGGQVTVTARFDAAVTTAFCGDPVNAVTNLCLPPVMYQMMADSSPFADADFSTLRRFICGGGRVSERLRAAYGPKGARFVPQYGGTESGPVTSMNPDRLDKIMVGSCGQKAMHIDIIFAAEHAKIGDPHVSIGFVTGDGGAVIWPQLIGYARAKEYLMTGDVMTAHQAAQMGLINHAVPADELDARVDAFADKLVAGATQAIRWTTMSVNIGLRDLFTSIMDASLAYEARSNGTPDHREAVRAFAEKRAPVFGRAGERARTSTRGRSSPRCATRSKSLSSGRCRAAPQKAGMSATIFRARSIVSSPISAC